MGAVLSWFVDDPDGHPLPKPPPPVESLRVCPSLRRLPHEVLCNIATFCEFQGVLAGAIPWSSPILHFAVVDATLIAADARELTGWSGLTLRHRVRFSASCLAHMQGTHIVWCGGNDGTIRLYSPELRCLRLANGHQGPVAALVVSSDSKSIMSFSERPGDCIREWDAQGVVLRTLADGQNIVKALNMSALLDPPTAGRGGGCGCATAAVWDEGGEQLWQGPAKRVRAQPGEGGCQAVCFDIGDGSSDLLQAGTTLITSPCVRVSEHCTAAVRAGHAVLCDDDGRERSPPWRLPARTQARASAICSYRGHLIVATSDSVIYAYR